MPYTHAYLSFIYVYAYCVCMCVCVTCVRVMRTLKALHEININFIFYYYTTKSGIRFSVNPAPRKISITKYIVRELFGENGTKKKNQHYLIPIALGFS